MFGPKLRARFDRGRGEGPVDLELGVLRDETEGAKLFVQWLSDNRVRYYLSQAFPQSMSSEQEFLRKLATDQSEIAWAIYANGQLVGSTGIGDVDRVNSRAEIGILIGHRDYWGKGIATAAEILAAEYAFSNVVAGGLNKLFARVLLGNDGSKKALENAGFREVGVFRRDRWSHGRWFDMWLSELLQEDWRRMREDRVKAAGIIELDICPGCEDCIPAEGC